MINFDANKIMPAVFVGHGNPMNAIEDNEFSSAWQELGKSLPRPQAILCISAHWETMGTCVTAMEKPRTIHDFSGFPQPLYQVQYPAPGSQSLANRIQSLCNRTLVQMNNNWGLDHGCWSVLKRMYPQADIPVLQLSLDYAKLAAEHYRLGRELYILRKENILVLGSGNMVHNLGRMALSGDDPRNFNRPFGFDWAIAADKLFKELIDKDQHERLIDYTELGEAVQLAVPTPEHYLPMLYILALKKNNEQVTYFNDKPLAGSLTMTGFILH